jgi:PAS domain S-box-containing protein
VVADAADDARSLRRDAARFRALASGSLDRVLEIAPDGLILYASPNHANTAGFESLRIVGSKVETFVHTEDLPALDALLRGAFDERRSMRATYRAHAPGGSWRWVEASLTPFENDDGELAGLLIARDVTENRQVESKLAESEQRLRLMTDNAYDVISVYEEDGTLLYANPSADVTFGWPADAPPFSDPFDVVHPDDRKEVLDAMARVFRGEPQFLKHRILRADGTWCWVESTSNVYVTETGDRRVVTIAPSAPRVTPRV